jgi:hypothetical protein
VKTSGSWDRERLIAGVLMPQVTPGDADLYRSRPSASLRPVEGAVVGSTRGEGRAYGPAEQELDFDALSHAGGPHVIVLGVPSCHFLHSASDGDGAGGQGIEGLIAHRAPCRDP